MEETNKPRPSGVYPPNVYLSLIMFEMYICLTTVYFQILQFLCSGCSVNGLEVVALSLKHPFLSNVVTHTPAAIRKAEETAQMGKYKVKSFLPVGSESAKGSVVESEL